MQQCVRRRSCTVWRVKSFAVPSSIVPPQVLGLGTDTGDTTPSVLLFFDNLRFLFNVGEGFQRFCVQVRRGACVHPHH